MIEKFFKYFHTIRFLKFSQIIWRILKRFKAIDTSSQKLIGRRVLVSDWHEVRMAKVRIMDRYVFEFLNKRNDYSYEVDWNDSEQDMLWLFNLHYFDDLCAPFDSKRNIWLQELVDEWIDSNPPIDGVAWEAYPLSLRIVNWIKWALNGQEMKLYWLHSLKLQAHILSQTVEYHLLGNHLLANAKALIFAGLYFEDKQSERWLNLGLKIYNQQLQEQIFSDGGHFELSPMYQNILLNDLLDLINIAESYEHPLVLKFLDDWRSKAGLMLSWAKIMQHPDGDISFFNDAAFGIAPTYNELISYALKIGVEKAVPSTVNFGGTKLTRLFESGYVRVEQDKLVAILDCAPIGPDYLPGHGHADNLSFELSLQNFRVFVNSGTSCYGLSEERVRQRSTSAHNTVMINGVNSSQVWSGFRVAKRAYPFALLVEGNDLDLKVSCSHDGYKRLKPPIVHRRVWYFADDAMTITDSLIGHYKTAGVYYLFHPKIVVSAVLDHFVLMLPNLTEIIIKISGGEPRLINTFWYPEFGQVVPTNGLVIDANSDNVIMSITGYTK